EYQRHSPLFDEKARSLDLEASLRSRDVPGGTAPERVAEALEEARRRLSSRETTSDD
ncbi:MAG: argininosuccinate lyase, partial [Acidobacteria bacterium]|nr:argininosuccinate lyase [Acidobacteriota bacterium]